MSLNESVKVLPAFSDAFTVAQRAAERIENMGREFDIYLQRGVRSFVSELEENRSVAYLLADPFHYPVSLEAGEILRGLRASLDYAVSAVYRAHSLRDDSSHVRWHTGKDKLQLEASLEGTIVKHGLGELKSFFLEQMDHTETSNSPIFHLNQIDRANKHRSLTVIITTTMAPLPNANVILESGSYSYYENTISAQPGKISSFPFPCSAKRLQFESNFKRSLNVVFGPNEHLPHAEVIPTLANFVNVVFECLLKFQDTCIEVFPDKFKR